MLAWILLLLLIAAEAGALLWWLRKEYYPFFFNGWAALLYSVALGLDFGAAWLVSLMLEPGGSTGLAVLTLAGVFLVVVVFAMTLFFRWVVRHDMTDPPP